MITEPDRSRRHERDDSVRSGEWPTNYRAVLHGVRVLRLHTPNKWESSGRMQEAAAKGPLGRNGQEQQERCAQSGKEAASFVGTLRQFVGELGEGNPEGAWPYPDDGVDGREGPQHPGADDLAQPPLEAIPLGRRVPVLRHDEPDPGMTQRGSEYPDLEERIESIRDIHDGL